MASRPKKSDPEAAPASPIAFRPCSNGEMAPVPESAADRRAEKMFQRLVEDKHRRVGMTRRQFADSACGMAGALLVINQVYGCASKSGGQGYDVRPDMTEDLAQACQKLDGNEFIFDVQVHPTNPLSPWSAKEFPKSADDLMKLVFVASDTTVACLSGVPGARGVPANVEANRQLQDIVDKYAGPRLLTHVNVDPPRGASELDYMAAVAGKHKVAAWKVYPHVGSWRLDQGVGLKVLAQARNLGIKVIAAHRGIGPGVDYQATSSPADLTAAAKAFPDVKFLTYHSGWDAQADENHPFDPANPNPVGVDRLVKGVLDNGIGNGKEGNVYAELGSTWRNLMTKPEAERAHVIGKLLKYLGEDRIIWGTDSVFTGSAQEQIVAMRAMRIPAGMQERYGYPELTDGARRKLFGLNAAAVYGVDPRAARCAIDDDALSKLKLSYREDPRSVTVPQEKSYGPRTRREWLAFLQWERAVGG